MVINALTPGALYGGMLEIGSGLPCQWRHLARYASGTQIQTYCIRATHLLLIRREGAA